MAVLNIERVNSLPVVLAASTMYVVKASDADKVELYFTSEDAATIRHIVDKDDILYLLATGNAATATALLNARTINGTAFDGTADITINAVDSTSRIAVSEKGSAEGVCPLGADSKVAAVYLPSYVDDVLEFANVAAFPATGESGKIYIDLALGGTHRWSGSAYIAITASPGSTDSVTEGATNKYFTESRVRAALLTGISLATSAVISASDSVLSALGKLQKQISDHFSSSSNPHSTTAAQVGAPTTAGVGATGTWPISISGNASTADSITGGGEELDSFLFM